MLQVRVSQLTSWPRAQNDDDDADSDLTNRATRGGRFARERKNAGLVSPPFPPSSSTSFPRQITRYEAAAAAVDQIRQRRKRQPASQPRRRSTVCRSKLSLFVLSLSLWRALRSRITCKEYDLVRTCTIHPPCNPPYSCLLARSLGVRTRLAIISFVPAGFGSEKSPPAFAARLRRSASWASQTNRRDANERTNVRS